MHPKSHEHLPKALSMTSWIRHRTLDVYAFLGAVLYILFE